MNTLDKIRSRPLKDLGFAAFVTAYLLATRGALTFLPYRRVEARLRPVSVRQRAPREERVDQVLWAVNAAGRRVLGSRPCLTQALVGRRLLAREGVATDLRIGVGRGEDDRLLAHAWLERDGRVILGGCRSPLRFRTFNPVTSSQPSHIPGKAIPETLHDSAQHREPAA